MEPSYLCWNLFVTQNSVTIPSTYADVTKFRFTRVLAAPVDSATLYDMISEVFDPTAIARTVAVVVRIAACCPCTALAPWPVRSFTPNFTRSVRFTLQSYGQQGLGKSELLSGSSGDLGVVSRALVDVFSQIKETVSDATLPGRPSVFLAAYETLGSKVFNALDANRLKHVGLDKRLVREVEVGHNTKAIAVMIGDAVSGLNVLQSVYTSRQQALAANPTVRWVWPFGARVTAGSRVARSCLQGAVLLARSCC